MSKPPSNDTRKLFVSSELLAAVVESTKDSIVITNTTLDEPGPTIVYVNTAFTEMTGYTFEEAVGKNPRFLQGPETDRRVLDDLRNRLSTGQLFSGKTVNYRKDGSAFINEWHIEPITAEDGKINHLLAIQHDVTERERIHQSLAVFKDKLLQKNVELENKNIELTNKNKALHELLQQIEREKQKVKEDIALNLEEVVLPMIAKVKRKGHVTGEQYLTVLENNLQNLSCTLGRSLRSKHLNLSPREVEIANMIRQGLSTKIIAEILNITARTIETHRNSIRQKLGIQNSKTNLSTYLQSL